jgi:DNA-binding transcriptional MerR regulator
MAEGIASTMQAIAPASIVELARLGGVDLATVDSYEVVGLLPKLRRRRGRSGDRAYRQEHLDRSMFIRRALEVGFGVPAILDLTDVKGGLRTCNDIARCSHFPAQSSAHLCACTGASHGCVGNRQVRHHESCRGIRHSGMGQIF